MVGRENELAVHDVEGVALEPGFLEFALDFARFNGAVHFRNADADRFGHDFVNALEGEAELFGRLEDGGFIEFCILGEENAHRAGAVVGDEAEPLIGLQDRRFKGREFSRTAHVREIERQSLHCSFISVSGVARG